MHLPGIAQGRGTVVKDDSKDDDEPRTTVTLSPHHIWNMAFDESRRISSATASAAISHPLHVEVQDDGAVRFYFSTDAGMIRLVGQLDAPLHWTVRTAFPDGRATRRFRRNKDEGSD
jgi:hypothetical protein